MAEQFQCSESWVRRLIQRRRETGSLAPRPSRLPNNNKLNEEKLMTAVGEMTVQELLTTMQVPPETIATLDAALRQIPNTQ